MNDLTLRLRHGTSAPIQANVPKELLERIAKHDTRAAINSILASLPDAQQAYGAAMAGTMSARDSVVEVVNTATDDAVTLGSTPRTFGETLAKVRGSADAEAGEVEIAAARLERGGAIAVEEEVGPAEWGFGPIISPAYLFDSSFAATFAPPGIPLVVWNQTLYSPSSYQSYRRSGAPEMRLPDGPTGSLTSRFLEDAERYYFYDYSSEIVAEINARAERMSRVAGSTAAMGSFKSMKRLDLSTPRAATPEWVVDSLIPVLRIYEGESLTAGSPPNATLDWSPDRKHLPPWSPATALLPSLFPSPVIILPHPDGGARVHELVSSRFRKELLPEVAFSVGRKVLVAREYWQPLERWRHRFLRRFDAGLEEAARSRCGFEQTAADLGSSGAANRERVRQAMREAQKAGERVLLYEDRLHSIYAATTAPSSFSPGVYLRRKVPEALIVSRNSDTGHDYCGYIHLPETYLEMAVGGYNTFYSSCVQADPNLVHPLVYGAGEMIMDRCEGDLARLQSSPNYPRACIKHLDDARLMLLTGHYQAASFPDWDRRDPSRLVKREDYPHLPVYRYRHAY